jgi:hypothetical protein
MGPERYVRFVLGQVFVGGRQRCGVFHAWDRLPRRRQAGVGPELREHFRWFNQNLPRPAAERFSSGRGLSWMKPDARSLVDRLRSLADLYRRAGLRVWEVHARDPGLITYEDEVQIVAVPYQRIPQSR